MIVLALFAGLFAGLCAAETIQHPATQSPLASKVLLNDAVRLDKKYLAVGLYGIIIYSSDGKLWHQAHSPTQNLLTKVFFVSNQEGWAGGHDSLILHTSDGGKNWDIQYEDPYPKDKLPKPILDILFVNNNTGYALGAYGLLLTTTDGGAHWNKFDTGPLYNQLESLDMEPEPNFNAAILVGDKILIVGELGTVILFDPNAESEQSRWEIINHPYHGTFFGVNALQSEELFIYGLRGNVYRSADLGLNWEKINTPTVSNLYDSVERDNGDLIIVGSSGTLLTVAAGSSTATQLPYDGFDTLISAQYFDRNHILLFGDRGTQFFSLESSKKRTNQ